MKLSTDCSAISKTKNQRMGKNLFELDAQIKVLNFVKSDIYKRAAAEYNKSVRDGLKEAVRLISMEPDKRLQAEAAKGYALRPSSVCSRKNSRMPRLPILSPRSDRSASRRGRRSAISNDLSPYARARGNAS